MKRNLSVASLTIIMCYLRLNAQPVLTASNSNPHVGEHFGYYYFDHNGFNPGGAGANQTWDFSGLDTLYHFNREVISPSATSYSASFPNSNLAEGDTNHFVFHTATAGSLTIDGEAGFFTSPYTLYDPEEIMVYPFTFGNSHSDSAYASIGINLIRKIKNTFSADGYGTLILPYKTFTNALRITIDTWTIDTSLLGFSLSTFHETGFAWYVPGIHNRVFQYSQSAASGSPTTYAYMLDSASAVISVPEYSLDDDASFTLYPNPASEGFKVQGSKLKVGDQLKIFDVMGKEIDKTVLTTLNIELETLNFPNGIYFVQLLSENNSFTQKLIVQH